jgi:hypothetical protein
VACQRSPRFKLEKLEEDLLQLGRSVTGAMAGQGLGGELTRLPHRGGQRRGRQRQVARGHVLKRQRVTECRHEQVFLASRVAVDGGF